MNADSNNAKSGAGDYERPGCRYRCGRGAAWGQPCAPGPTLAGKCAGAYECQPVMKDGKPICRRPREAGGPCSAGPKADVTCSQTHPPCIPRLTLRARRGRLVWQALVFTGLLLVACFPFGPGGRSRPLAADAGPLSTTHANFAGDQGCATCHPAHGSGVGGLLRAAFTTHDMSGQCLNCHQFDGNPRAPHNHASWEGRNSRGTDCRQCHVEHRGARANLTVISDAQCHTCHQAKFDSFAQGHPAFPSDFPVTRRGAIKFNHAKHLQDYYQQAAFKDRANANCAACHVATVGEAGLRTLGFDAACARCHDEQIGQSELVLLRLPEPVAPEDPLGTEDATPFMAWLLQRDGADANDYGKKLRQLLTSLEKDGASPLAESLARAGGKSTSLIAGLNPELLSRAAAQWNQKQQYTPPATKPASGWYWMEDLYPELRYIPAGHGDPVARAWTEFALSAPARETNGTSAKLAASFRDEAAHARSGVGRCAKCHGISAAAEQPLTRQLTWNYGAAEPRAHTKFSHGAHLGLRQCSDCHDLNAKADYEAQFVDLMNSRGTSGFHAIAQASCTECHAEGKVRADCQLCHEYHREPTVKAFKMAGEQLSSPPTGAPKSAP